MFRSFARFATYERLALILTGLCVVGLYVMALSPWPAAAYPTMPTITVIEPEVRVVPRPPARPYSAMLVHTSDKLSAVFDRIGYRLDNVRRHGRVPRLFLASLPADLSRIAVPRERKLMFIKAALPLILQVNELILAERRRVATIRDELNAGFDLGQTETAWLARTLSNYGVDVPDLDELLRRIDIIPPSMALAQSAEESGWGTSRVAREGNALFGQRIFKGTRGLVPLRRDEGQRHRVRAFRHLIDGVKAYADNLNIHPAYTPFRAARARARSAGARPDGASLVGTLEMYSERRGDYVKTIGTIIRVNGLRLYDGARLGDRLTIIGDAPDA
jgi:Bax protein